MSDLFETNEDEITEAGDDFEEVEVDLSVTKDKNLDARRRLENMLDEKRLRDDLDDFWDF